MIPTIPRVCADDSRHFIGEVNLIFNGFKSRTRPVTMPNHADKLRGHKAFPRNGGYWLASLNISNGIYSVMIVIIGTILFKHRIYCRCIRRGWKCSKRRKCSCNSPRVVKTHVNAHQIFKTRQLRLLFWLQSILTKAPQHTRSKDTRITTGLLSYMSYWILFF